LESLLSCAAFILSAHAVAAGEVDRKKADETLSSSPLWKQLLVVEVHAGEDQLVLSF